MMTQATADPPRSIWHWHEHPRLVAWVSTPTGKVVLWLVATGLMPRRVALTVAPLVALVLIWPERRREILSVGSLWVAYRLLDLPLSKGTVGGIVLGMAAILGLVYLIYRTARDFQRLPAMVRRHPLMALHLGFWLAMFLVWTGPVVLAGDEPSHLWSVVRQFRVILPFLVWRFAYVMLSGQRGSARLSRFTDHLFYCLPVFGGTNVPYGKGADYLSRRTAADPEAMARTGLAGLKLLGLAWIWNAARAWLGAGIHGELHGYGSRLVREIGLGLPRMQELIAGGADGTVMVAWTSLFVELVDRTLVIAILGHVIIGVLRLFGFNVFRNTYKPLLADSILEFWNRFYYYFKELLVEFFFFPTFVSYFKRNPELRMFAAVMAAAFLGNVYYHVVRDLNHLIYAGPVGAWTLLAPRVFYSVLLGLGVYFSMRRQQAKRGTPPPPAEGTGQVLGRVRRIAGVWLFFALIHIWNINPARLDFGQRTSFFLSLFGFG